MADETVTKTETSDTGIPAAKSSPADATTDAGMIGWLNWPGLPFVAPLTTFLVLTMLETELKSALSYELVYTLKVLCCGFVLFLCRTAFPRWNGSGITAAIGLGVAGCVLWVVLDAVQRSLLDAVGLAAWIPERAGYQIDGTAWSLPQAAFVGVRLLGLTVIVPLAEEICWRGFLSPFLVNEDFQTVSPGHMTRGSFLIVTGVFTSLHPEFLAAFVWCSLINLLWIRNRNLWACIAAHASTNLVLGVYVLTTGNWHLW